MLQQHRLQLNQESLIALENSVLFLSTTVLTSVFHRYLFISAWCDVMGLVWALSYDLISVNMHMSNGMHLKLDIHPLEEMLNCLCFRRWIFTQDAIAHPCEVGYSSAISVGQGNFGVAFLQVKAHLDLCPCERGLCMVLASVAGCSGNEIILFYCCWISGMSSGKDKYL